MNITNYADRRRLPGSNPNRSGFSSFSQNPNCLMAIPKPSSAILKPGRGVIAPQMCTDKALDELGDFSDLVKESRSWHSGRGSDQIS